MKSLAAKPSASVSPCYFGATERPLFGCFHEPHAAGRRPCAVLICQPIGHEYINCHRALRQLAARLADAGFPVLRFDYYGCGDSFGGSEDGTIAQWLEDISTAISHLRKQTGLTRVCLVGLRLGGSLSAMVSAQRGDIESLVLWDPVLDGRNYLQELFSLQKEMLRFRPRPKRKQQLNEYVDVLGFPLSEFLRNEIERSHLLQWAGNSAKNVLIVQSDPPEGDDSLRNHFSRNHIQLEYQHQKAPQLWLPVADGSLLVPTPVLQSIVSWAERTHS